jgi:hypothetical protein
MLSGGQALCAPWTGAVAMQRVRGEAVERQQLEVVPLEVEDGDGVVEAQVGAQRGGPRHLCIGRWWE